MDFISGIVISVASGLISGVIWAVGRWMIKQFNLKHEELRKDVNRIYVAVKVQDMQLEAINYSCERNIDNGKPEKPYSTERDNYHAKLIKEYELLHAKETT